MRVYLPVMNAGMPSFEKIFLLWSISTCNVREFTYALPIYPPLREGQELVAVVLVLFFPSFQLRFQLRFQLCKCIKNPNNLHLYI